MTPHLLITGGGGFVGSHAATHFAGNGWTVTALDNLSREALLGQSGPIPGTYRWDRLKKVDGVTLVKGDVRQLEDLQGPVDEADAILHTAAQVAVTTSLEDPRTDFDVNLQGTFNVLEVARSSDGDPKVLFCSTNKVYGGNVNWIPVKERGSRYELADTAYADGIPTNYPIDASEHTPYGVSKLGADLYVQDYAQTYGMKTATFRMSCIYGPGQSGNEDQGWVAHFILSILRGESLTIYGDGKQVRDVLHVDDLVLAFVAALDTEEALQGKVFNVGGGPENTLSLLELVDLVEGLSGKRSSVRYEDWRPGDQKVYISDISRATEVLGWRPSISPDEGVAGFIEWYETDIGA